MMKEFISKLRVTHLLKNRRENNYVSVQFEGRDLVLVKDKRKSTMYYVIELPERELEQLQLYLSNGQFLIYNGRVQTHLYHYILKLKKKWRNIAIYEERGE